MKALEIYEAMSKPPIEALKEIGAGRQKGKSNINPQWRYRVMTEQFGLCGIAWKYQIDKQWTEKGSGNEVMCFVNVSVFVKDGDTWSDAVPGTGGNKIVMDESKGPYNNDEGFKMATTDAISNALKFIGVGASIYAGEWDGERYVGAAATAEALREQLLDYVNTGDLPENMIKIIDGAIKRKEENLVALNYYFVKAKEEYEKRARAKVEGE